MNNKLFLYLFYATTLFSLFLIGSYLFNSVVGGDSGFYLSVAREMYDGKVYFQDIGISYNPLSILLFGIPYLFNDTPPFAYHLLMNIIAMLLSAFVFFKVLCTFSNNRIRNKFFASFYLLLILVLDGKHIMLEPFSVLFLLLALLYYLKYINNNRMTLLFLSSIFVSLAFLSKQYGLFILFPIGISILYRKTTIMKETGIIAIGFAIPIFTFYLYLHNNGMDFTSFLQNILGKGFEYNVGNGTGLKTSFLSYYIDFIYIILFNLYILTIPYLYYKYREKMNVKILLFSLLAISSMSVLIFANYWHYYQYIVPFFLLLYLFLSKNNEKTKLDITLTLSLVILIFYSLITLQNNSNRISNNNSEQLLSHIPKNSSVYLDGLPASYYYTCQYHSIDLKKIGFTFSGFFSPNFLLDHLDAGEYLLISEKKINLYKESSKNLTFSKIQINNKGYFIITKKNS